jgi:hypothetical protein
MNEWLLDMTSNGMLVYHQRKKQQTSNFNSIVIILIDYYLTLYTTCVCLEFEPRSWRGVLDTTLCDKACLTSGVVYLFLVFSLMMGCSQTDILWQS